MTSHRLGPWLLLAGLVGPLAAGAALIPLRGRIDNTNIALLLVVAVVAVASGGRRPAAVAAAISAATAFNLFHTKPYYSLRIDKGGDVVTALLLLAVGITVGELSLHGRRARSVAEAERENLKSIHGLGRLVAEGEDPDYILLATASELTHLLHLVDCKFETEPSDDRILPVVERDGTVLWGPTTWESERWGLPTDGVAIPVQARGRARGRFVLRAPVALPFTKAQLSRAVALVDQAGAALAGQSAA